MVSFTLFSDENPDAADKDFIECLNPNSLEVLAGCKAESSLAEAKAPANFQFLRQGYFCLDSKDSAPGHLVFNRSVSLKDSSQRISVTFPASSFTQPVQRMR